MISPDSGLDGYDVYDGAGLLNHHRYRIMAQARLESAPGAGGRER
jgi:hypothetical protein